MHSTTGWSSLPLAVGRRDGSPGEYLRGRSGQSKNVYNNGRTAASEMFETVVSAKESIGVVK